LFRVNAFIKAGQIRRRNAYGDINSNGVRWYYVPDKSVGFAPQGQGISLNSADTTNSGSWDRISWHLHRGRVGGWRCGGWCGLNGDYHRRKVVMYKHHVNTYKMKKGQTPPTGIFLNRLSLKNLVSAGYKYTLNPNYHTYNSVTRDNNLWPPDHTKWMMLGCKASNSDTLTLGAFARYAKIAPTKKKYHRRRNFMAWENGVYWYVHSGKSVGFAPGGVSLNSADTNDASGNYRLSWHFEQNSNGWRCGMQKGNYGSIQKIAMYYGVSTTTTTTTTTLVQMELVTWVLPEKISWKVMKGKKVVCKGANYDKWYSTIPTGCRLEKGKYTLECLDSRGWGWGEGYMKIKSKTYCKKFLWKGTKRVESFIVK